MVYCALTLAGEGDQGAVIDALQSVRTYSSLPIAVIDMDRTAYAHLPEFTKYSAVV